MFLPNFYPSKCSFKQQESNLFKILNPPFLGKHPVVSMGKMMKTFFGIRKIHLLTSPGSLSLSSVPKFRQTVPTTVPKLNSETEKKFSSTYLVQHFDNSYDYLLYLAFRTSILIISMNIFFIQLLEPAFHFLEKLSLFLLSIHNQYYIYCLLQLQQCW